MLFLSCLWDNPSLHDIINQHGSHTTTFIGHLKDEDHLEDVKKASIICIPIVESNGVFHVRNVVLHLLKIKFLFGGQPYGDANLNIKNFIYIFSFYSTLWIFQKSPPLKALSILIYGWYSFVVMGITHGIYNIRWNHKLLAI